MPFACDRRPTLCHRCGKTAELCDYGLVPGEQYVTEDNELPPPPPRAA